MCYYLLLINGIMKTTQPAKKIKLPVRYHMSLALIAEMMKKPAQTTKRIQPTRLNFFSILL